MAAWDRFDAEIAEPRRPDALDIIALGHNAGCAKEHQSGTEELSIIFGVVDEIDGNGRTIVIGYAGNRLRVTPCRAISLDLREIVQ